MNPHDEKYAQAFARLLGIMNELRAQCPWDKKQTMESLRHLTIEETYELTDAIIAGDLEEIRKELGDLFLHIVFYSKIASEQEAFDIADVLNGVCDKLIHRHPHVYGDVNAEDEAAVKRNWELLKLKEKGDKKVLSGVPSALPALLKAQRVQEKARGVGFDWQNMQQVWDKVREEIAELEETVEQQQGQARQEEEFGDLLFSLVNYARFAGMQAETVLDKATRKFIRRFNAVEEQIKADGEHFENLNLEQLDAYWEAVKRTESKESI